MMEALRARLETMQIKVDGLSYKRKVAQKAYSAEKTERNISFKKYLKEKA